MIVIDWNLFYNNFMQHLMLFIKDYFYLFELLNHDNSLFFVMYL